MSKIKTQEKKQSFNKVVLMWIAEKSAEAGSAFLNATMDFFEYPHVPAGHADGIRAERAYWDEKHTRQRARYALEELQRQKFIEMRKKGNGVIVQLTDDGRLHVLRQQMKSAPACVSGECIMVTFDIPEAARGARLYFRRFLKECNFVQSQKSVWICDRSVLPQLLSFIKLTNIDKWVHAFIAKEVPHLQELRKKRSEAFLIRSHQKSDYL